jgi:hypothetical protein
MVWHYSVPQPKTEILIFRNQGLQGWIMSAIFRRISFVTLLISEAVGSKQRYDLSITLLCEIWNCFVNFIRHLCLLKQICRRRNMQFTRRNSRHRPVNVIFPLLLSFRFHYMTKIICTQNISLDPSLSLFIVIKVNRCFCMVRSLHKLSFVLLC